MTNKISTTVTDAANKILGQHHDKKKSRITNKLLGTCDKRRGLKKGMSSPEAAEKYREINKEVKRYMQEAKGNWTGEQCSTIEGNLNKKRIKEHFKLLRT